MHWAREWAKWQRVVPAGSGSAKPEGYCHVAQAGKRLLLIADISGYTGYLAGVELDHAQDILADLMDTIVGALRPPFHLSKLEGDAAFVYLASSDLDGSLLQDIVEATYFTPAAAARHQAGFGL